MPSRMRQWGGPRPLGSASLAVLSLVVTAGAARGVEDRRTVVGQADGGSRVLSTRSAGGRAAAEAVRPACAPAGGGEVLWSRSLTDATYTSAGLTMPSGRLVAGTYLNPPRQLEVHDVVGDGTPAWTVPGQDVEVAAARRAGVVAALDQVGPQTLTLGRWDADTDEPVWTYGIDSATPGTFRGVVVSADGSTIAVLVTRQAEVNNARLYLFDADAGAPTSIYDAPGGTFGRNLDITDDGSLVAFMGGASVFVFDRDADALRYSVSAGATNDAIGISGDGDTLAYGWRTLFVRRWSGATYDLAWTRPGGTYSLRHCRLDADGETLVAGWSRQDSAQNRVDLHDAVSSEPTWSSVYDAGGGAYQDVIWDLAITADGGHCAVASWSDQLDTNPELHVFARSGPTAIFTLDTPGSLFATDIARGAGGALTVTAAGKHVHANQQGRGGDLYAVRIPIACAADLDAGGSVGFEDLLRILAAWGPCTNCPEDLDASGSVDFPDILAVLSAWGPCE